MVFIFRKLAILSFYDFKQWKDKTQIVIVLKLARDGLCAMAITDPICFPETSNLLQYVTHGYATFWGRCCISSQNRPFPAVNTSRMELNVTCMSPWHEFFWFSMDIWNCYQANTYRTAYDTLCNCQYILKTSLWSPRMTNVETKTCGSNWWEMGMAELNTRPATK
jgi:hypothetical protein